MTRTPFADTQTVHVSQWAPIAPGFLLRARVVRHGGTGLLLRSYVVEFEWATSPTQVDRPSADAIDVGGDKGVAMRLAAATANGQTHRDPFIKTDLDGFTYVEARRRLHGRALHADLAAVGH